MSFFLMVLTLVPALALLLNPLGQWFWFLDLGTHFLHQQLVMILVFGSLWIATRSFKKAGFVVGVSLAVAAALFVFQQTSLAEDGQLKKAPLKVISLNVLTKNTNKEGVIQWLKSQIPKEGDVLIFLMEVNPDWIEAMQPLKEVLKYSVELPRSDNFGVAMYSSLDLNSVRPAYYDELQLPALVGNVNHAGTILSVFGVHTIPPVGEAKFRQRNLYMDNLQQAVAKAEGIALVMGDFNCSPWSPNIKRIKKGRGDGAGLVDPFPSVFRPHTWGGLGIVTTVLDYVMAESALIPYSASVGPDLGSDHLPVVVQYGL